MKDTAAATTYHNVTLNIDSAKMLLKISLVQHIISSCPLMSSKYYLPMRRDIVAKASYNTVIKNQKCEKIFVTRGKLCYKSHLCSNIKMTNSGGAYPLKRQQTPNAINLT